MIRTLMMNTFERLCLALRVSSLTVIFAGDVGQLLPSGGLKIIDRKKQVSNAFQHPSSSIILILHLEI